MRAPKIIFEDEDVLIINKPSGLVVNRAETVRGKTLQDWVEENTQILKYSNKQTNKFQEFFRRSGIVHRLDKDTSGVMVVAKNGKSFVNLQRQFKERKVIKKYLALVHGRVEPRVGDIKMPLARKREDRKKFAVRLRGRKALTSYKKLSYLSRDRMSSRTKNKGSKDKEWFSLLEAQPKTGRTHQIRVHMKHIGHPIVSDPIYLGEKRLKKDKKWCPRLFLHAQYLSFSHPKTGKRVEFEAKLPEILNKTLDDHSTLNQSM